MAEPVVVPPVVTPPPEADPEGAIDVQGQKFVPVSALVAERNRARETTEERLRREFEPVKAQADQAARVQADLAAIQPQIEYLNQHPELLQPKADAGPQVSDEEAEKYARRLELYTASGLDTRRAKQIIADNRVEMTRVAHDAAEQAIKPAMQATALQSSRQNFVMLAQRRGADGRPVVSPEALAKQWAKLDPALTANPDVAETVLRIAIGESAMTGGPGPLEREPLYTEAPGGATQPYRMSGMERTMAKTAGLTDQQWTDRAKQYQPDRLNVLGD